MYTLRKKTGDISNKQDSIRSTDTAKLIGLRHRMIHDLKKLHIVDENVLDAMSRIPRHYFMDSSLLEHAYALKAFPIACEQTISNPYTVALQTQVLDVKKHQKILEIGTGSGYQTAVLRTMGARVFSVERHKILHDNSKYRLEKYLKEYMNVSTFLHLRYGDGYKGWDFYQPFDRIIVTCGSTEIPKILLQQLKIGGYIVIPLGGQDTQVLTKIVRKGEDAYEEQCIEGCLFVPMLKGKDKNDEDKIKQI